MSRFLSNKYASLEPYTPGEQPKTNVLTKLNTNESPFPPMPEVIEAVKKEAERLQLYPDPDATELRKALAGRFDVDPDKIIVIMADKGPGIPNLEKAMQPGWSTASNEARELGFGAGMGLPNIKKWSSNLKVETEIGVGTTLTMEFDL